MLLRILVYLCQHCIDGSLHHRVCRPPFLKIGNLAGSGLHPHKARTVIVKKMESENVYNGYTADLPKTTETVMREIFKILAMGTLFLLHYFSIDVLRRGSPR